MYSLYDQYLDLRRNNGGAFKMDGDTYNVTVKITYWKVTDSNGNSVIGDYCGSMTDVQGLAAYLKYNGPAFINKKG